MQRLALLVLFPLLIQAQTFQGSLRGRVVDPNGSATQSARLTITDEATLVSRSSLSNEQGEYVFTALNPATYTIQVEAPGFKRLERKGVIVSTQAAVLVDLNLQLGEVSEAVNVTAESPLLQASDASTGQLIDNQKVTDLPILGRNPFYVAKLAQTVVYAGNPKFARMQDHNANAQVSIAGGPLRSNNYMIDGISITDSSNRSSIVPSPEAVQELKLQASTYDAEVGRTGGGTFNTLLRSGSNEFHGSAVGHIRETEWQANDFFANRAGRPRAEQPFRDWGASFGGPILIPKIYDGRNRTFFFLSTEAYRQRDGQTSVYSVPTALERIGDFSESFAPLSAGQAAQNLQTIYDPLTTTSAGLRTPFAGNRIPLNRINQVGSNIASYYPLPNGGTAYHGAPNFSFTGSSPNRGDQYIYKADHQFASWLRASGSYIFQKSFETSTGNSFNNAAYPGQGFCCDRKVDATQANATITPDPATVISVRWGFNRLYSRSSQASDGFSLASLGFPSSLVQATPNPAFPAITMTNLSSFGGGQTSQNVFYSRNFNAVYARFLGRHSLKSGFDFRTIHDSGVPSSGPSSFGFSDVFTRSNPRSATTGQGSGLATLLLGYPTSGDMNVVGKFDNYIRYFGWFIHDDYRVSSKLTLNFGARFEYESGIRDVNNHLVIGFDRTAPNPLSLPGLPLVGTVQYAGVNGNPDHTFSPRRIKPSPRFGFAYSADSKTVVRGGYGIFWAPTYFNFQNAIGYSQNTPIITSTDSNFTPAATLTNPYPNGLLQPSGNSLGGASGIGQALTIPDVLTRSAGYVQQYSLEVQRQVPAGFVLTVGALGSHSLGLFRSGQNINQLHPDYFSLGSALLSPVANPLYNNGGVGSVGTPTVNQNQLYRPFPQFTSVSIAQSDSAKARYYSAYVRAEKRLSGGFSVLASYTFSRSVDNITSVNTAGTNQITAVTGPQNAYDLNGEWSLSTHDIPHRWTSSVSYELPFGKGKPFLRNHRFLDYIAGGWAVNAMNVYQSGYPLGIVQPNNNSVIGSSYQRPNATGINPASEGSAHDRLDGWFNPAAFSQAPLFTFGNVGRYINVRGHRTANIDLSVFKSFTFVERFKAQFRAEALNAFNTPIFGKPNTTYTASQFGVVTSQVNAPRLVQLAVRITF